MKKTHPNKKQPLLIEGLLQQGHQPSPLAFGGDSKAGGGGRGLLSEEGGGSRCTLGEAVGMGKREAPVGLVRGASITFSKRS